MHPTERVIVSAVVLTALNEGLSVSVDDAEIGAWSLVRSRDYFDIMAELGHMEEDFIRLHDYTRGSLGWVHFVYGNEPYYVICDHGTSDALESVMSKVQPLIDAYEAAEEARHA